MCFYNTGPYKILLRAKRPTHIRVMHKCEEVLNDCPEQRQSPRFNSSGCHLTALGGTLAACGSAFLAMLHLMLAALFRTHVTKRRACLADKLCSFAAPCHHCRSQPAQLRAIDVQGDTTRHHLYVILLQTRCRTHVACVSTIVARFNTALVVFMHDALLKKVGFSVAHRTSLSLGC